MLDENMTLDEVREFFGHDLFATQACGCQVMEAARGHAVCEFEIGPQHVNAQGNVMGGAIFTLADFALAVACNVGEEPTVAVTNTIQYYAQPNGTRLVATAEADRSGRSMGFYTIDIADELGTKVARMASTCFRRG